MSNARKLMINTLLLSFGGIAMRGIELCFRGFLAARAGAENMGIYGLVMSAYMVFTTISISGIGFCVTRLCAEAVGKGDFYPRKLMHSAFLYCTFFGILSGGIMFLFSGKIATVWIGEESTAFSLRVLALSLPPMAIRAAIGGYFTGKEKIFRLVLVLFIDSITRIFVTVWGFYEAGTKNTCSILALGETLGEFAGIAVILTFYACDIFGKKQKTRCRSFGLRIIKTALPLAVSAYTRTGLSSLGHMLVPFGLRKSGIGKAGAFAAYGIIHQMAFPVILFPAALLSSLGEALVPVLTGAQVCGRKMGISYMVNRALRISLVFCTAVAGMMYLFASDLSLLFYKTTDAAKYIKLFSFLIPVMYLDGVTDGCLKGLGQQMYSMAVNIADALLNVILLYYLLPVYAVNGYIVTVFICEIMNFLLSIKRLCKITCINIPPCYFLTSFSAVILAKWAATAFSVYGLFMKAAVYFFVYLGCIYIGNGSTREDFRWLKGLYFEKKA